MSHQGTSCGEICSPRLLRFYSLHTTINYNKQTCLTSKSGAHHPLLSHSLVGGSVFARTAAKGYFHCEGHLQQLAQVFFFFTSPPPVNMKSITWHHHGNRLIFFRRHVVGEIHQGHRCGSRTVNNRPNARGKKRGGHCSQ